MLLTYLEIFLESTNAIWRKEIVPKQDMNGNKYDKFQTRKPTQSRKNIRNLRHNHSTKSEIVRPVAPFLYELGNRKSMQNFFYIRLCIAKLR